MISRRNFLTTLIGFLLSSCSTTEVSYESPISLRDSIIKIKDRSDIKAVGERYIRISTFLMVAPTQLRMMSAGQKTMLSSEDYIRTSVDDLIGYSRHILHLNIEYLKNTFIVGEEDEILKKYGEKRCLIQTKESLLAVLKFACAIYNIMLLEYNKALENKNLATREGLDIQYRALLSIKLSAISNSLFPEYQCTLLQTKLHEFLRMLEKS